MGTSIRKLTEDTTSFPSAVREDEASWLLSTTRVTALSLHQCFVAYNAMTRFGPKGYALRPTTESI